MGNLSVFLILKDIQILFKLLICMLSFAYVHQCYCTLGSFVKLEMCPQDTDALTSDFLRQKVRAIMIIQDNLHLQDKDLYFIQAFICVSKVEVLCNCLSKLVAWTLNFVQKDFCLFFIYWSHYTISRMIGTVYHLPCCSVSMTQFLDQTFTVLVLLDEAKQIPGNTMIMSCMF